MTAQEQQKAFFDYAQAQLRQRLGVGPDDWMNPHNVLDPLGTSIGPGLKAYYAQNGGLNLPYGVTPSATDVEKFIQQSGGYPNQSAPAGWDGLSGTRQATSNNVTAAQRAILAQKQSQPTAFQQLVDSFKQQMARANAANEFRYQQDLGLLGGLHDRNQRNDANWGYAEGQINEERAKEAYGNESAALAARGLGNSTILPAFQQRNLRDLALTQQALSEQRDQRLAQDDTRDTTSLAQFIERRNDVAPDISQLQGLAQLYGSSGALAQQQGQQPMQPQGPQAPVFTPAAGQGQGGGPRFYPSPIGGAGIGAQPYFATINGMPSFGLPGQLLNGSSNLDNYHAAQQGSPYDDPRVQQFMAQYSGAPAPMPAGPENSAGQDRVAMAQLQQALAIQRRRNAGYNPGDATSANARMIQSQIDRTRPPQLGIPSTNGAAAYMQHYNEPSVFEDPTYAYSY